MKIYTSENIKALEKLTVEKGTSMSSLMAKAGNAVADTVIREYSPRGKNVVVLCGKGNNGGDGYVCANKLFDCGALVRVILVQGLPTTELALDAFNELYSAISVCDLSKDGKEAVFSFILDADIIIDGIFGFGFKGAVRGDLTEVIESVNKSKAETISIDIPSGVCCDSGEVLGEAVKADLTVTFSAIKPAFVSEPGKSFCGKISLASVGIDKDDIKNCETDFGCLSPIEAKKLLIERKSDSNKGTYGRLVIICGSMGMVGACVMCAKGALRSGVGLVNIVVTKDIYPLLAVQLSEPIFTVLDFENLETKKKSFEKLTNALSNATAVVMGCGLGELAEKYVPLILENCVCPIVLDADALNYISLHMGLLENRNYPIIVTPHPGEMSRLTGKEIAEIQANRISTAIEFSKKYGVITLLKGSGTVICSPNKDNSEEIFTHINTSGNAGMAKGGSGDVLSGIIGALAAEGISPDKAALLGAYVHGRAGDLAAKELSQTACLPTDFIEYLPKVYKELE